MIIRPQVAQSSEVLQIGDYRRGALCQAKLKDGKGKWGRFTPNQRKVLPGRLGYLCLLLYSYEDTERRNLRNFQWHICGRETMSQLEEHLKRDTFPSPVESNVLIHAIGRGLIGTDDNDILNKIVSPRGNPVLIIRISWPDGRHPGPQVSVHVTHSQQINVQARQIIHY